VLCGGASSRMGRPKLSLPFGQQSMLERVVGLVEQAVPAVVVVAAKGQSLPVLPAQIRVVRDEMQAQGPMAGMAAGMKALQGEADAVFVSSCDAPFVAPALIHRLFELLGDNAICMPEVEGFKHPLAAVYRIEVLAKACELLARGNMRSVSLCDELPTRIVLESELRLVDSTLATFRNLNTPEAYERALGEAGLS
jgi:molybdenum cofactor guanylyltransferase